ncbi:hypothetical protein [Brazilian marseillevirus]|uniref:hypothetical protein n=1 Tax=Brazilian marseillevirus TaxID=1813599 RepID=UPI0007861809|nr:hypothetical protein A3303_gp237 [Brazilian marseillevirus]AMQ10745.1 hypothetical protein [Brazilian marseillevirus]
MHKFLDTPEALSFSLVFGEAEDLTRQFLVFGTSECEKWSQLPDGSPHGKHTTKCSNQKIMIFWEKGKKHGVQETFISGSLIERIFWDKGEKTKTICYDGPFACSEQEYRNGQISGTSRQWIKGKLYTETEWKNGQMNGEQRTYSQDTGKIHSTSHWINGVPERVVIH